MGKKSGENIRVVIRKRPMLGAEKQNCKEAVHLDLALGRVAVQNVLGDSDSTTWTFDAVYDESVDQVHIFKMEVLPLVQSVLDGYNATVFAYGQSGSGKTHTMTGTKENPNPNSLMPLALHNIFQGVGELDSPQKTYRIKVQYIEIYNGGVRDLLVEQHRKKPRLLETMNFNVVGALNPEVANPADCMKLFHEGTERRVTASTGLNEHSSRSHAIFTLTVISTDHETGTPVIMQSKLNLCDLAGSEKQSKTNTSGEELRQGCEINKSLAVLGIVIDKLVKGNGHVPYRSSPLTMLLKDSLGGNSKTVMFANIGPADINTAETISTLRFADRAKQIENKPVKNLDPKDQHIADLKAQVEDLKKRLARGGGGNMEAEDKMREQIENLELERDQDKQSWERDKLELEGDLSEIKARNQTLIETVEKSQLEVQSAIDQKKIEENLVVGLKDELADMKRMVMDFIQRILPDEVLHGALQRFNKEKGAGASADDDSDLWDRNKIWGLMEAFHEHSKKNKGVSSEEAERAVSSVKEELEGKLKSQADSLERERGYFQEELKKEKEQRTDEMEAQSKLKSELQAKEQEVVRLKEKITRDLDKFKQKLQQKQKDRDEIQGKLQGKEEELQEKVRTLERLGTKLSEQEGSVDQRLKERTVELRSVHEKELEEARRTMEGKIETVEGEKTSLLNKMNQLEIQVKQSVRKALVQKAQGGTAGDGAGEIGEGGVGGVNDGFLDEAELENLGDDTIDKDMFEELHVQVRLQCRLQRLRHLQQKQLDTLIERYHKAAGDNRGKISEEKMLQQVQKAVSEKEGELENLRQESQKTQDKLVKRINKKLAEFQETEQKLQEEMGSLEEENKELTDMNDRMGKQHEQALETATTLKAVLEQREAESESEKRRLQREVQQGNAQLVQMDEDMEELRKVISKGKGTEQQLNDVKKEYELTRINLRDQRGQVDAQRARLKNMEEMWAEEKGRNEELRQQLEEARARVEKTELHYQEVVKDHGTKMSKLLHEKLEEQQQHYMDELHEQQLHEKTIKDKLKNARKITQKSKQKFDEMVLENEKLQTQFEEFKISAFRFHQESETLAVEDNTEKIREMIRNQNNTRKEQNDAFTGTHTAEHLTF
eukprot:TRINITY_DN332_c1_g1_i1.p1 TRINITY_DN332_c1_g1~~TRINITY_DN332_c1_g1_i1.p1  ORF type:complete len:1136 (+),score=488.91 TRINITY_DN332_c1_g1_i1:54-3410(+)